MAADLRHLGFPVEQTVGRRYPELPHPYRNEFQRDRDRIVHARAFRRLENKTQVFAPGLSDHFRNRLTHTLEVAQIARTVASVLGLNEDLVETLALAHDIGHPPFAHAGELELKRQMERFGETFNHNHHALRIVEEFESRYALFPGLNLTFEVREGIVKHSRDLLPQEAELFADYLPALRPPLEAQLIDLADEVAYNTADLDDAWAAGLFTLDELTAEAAGYAEIFAAIEQQYPGAPERIRFLEALRRLIDQLVSGLIEGTYWAAMDAKVNSVADVRRHPTRLATFTPPAAQLNGSLKAFLHRHVYSCRQLAAARERSCSMLAELFHHFLAHPQHLPDFYAEQIHRGRPPHRVVCDYIAGMTDGFFLRTYQTLLGRSEP